MFFYCFFWHRFYVDFTRIFNAQNHELCGKTKGLERFGLFRQSMKNQCFWCPFWPHFGTLFAYIFDTFSTSIFRCLFRCHFSTFCRKWLPKWAVAVFMRGSRGRPKTLPKTPPRRNLEFSSIWDRFGEPFWSYFHDFGINFGIIS